MLQGLPKDIYKLINHNIKAKAILDNVKMLLAGSELTKEDRESQLYDEFERFKMLPCENINEYYDGRVVVQNVQGRQNQNQRNFTQGAGATGNGGAHNRAGNANAVLDEEELLFLADECDAFDSNVDDEPTAQSIFMASLSFDGPVNLQAGPSNASILSEVHDLDNVINPSNNDQTHHVPVIVTSSEEDLELAETTRIKMNEKMNDPVCGKEEVIRFFNLLKEHFDGVQKSLVKEVRAIKAVFDNMEAEVDQNAIDKKLDISRFNDINNAYHVEKNRTVELKAAISKLKRKIHEDDHESMVKHFSKLEIDHLNFQLKYQHLKEKLETVKSTSSNDVPEFDTFFEINKQKEQL
ncbi:hypothetical protein Tco_0694062 [Tanacetum coccineum]